MGGSLPDSPIAGGSMMKMDYPSNVKPQQPGPPPAPPMKKKPPTLEELQRAVSDIACYNDNPAKVLTTLKAVAKKLLKNEERYRTLDTSNRKVQERYQQLWVFFSLF